MSDQSSDLSLTPQQPEISASSIEISTSQRLQQIANGTLILATLLLFAGLYSTLQTRNPLPGTLGVIFFLLTVGAAFLRFLSSDLRVWLLVGAFGLAGIAGLSLQPFAAFGVIFVLMSVALSALLHTQLHWRAALIIEVAAVILIAMLHSANLIRWENILVDENSVIFWVSLVAMTTYLAWIFSFAVASGFAELKHWLVGTFSKDAEISRKDEALQRENIALEKQLDRRRYLSIAARQISREISQLSSPSELMQTAVNLINQQFDFYYTALFLKDERSEFAVLKAGVGEAGAAMLARQHKLRIREEGVVGFVVARGEIRIASDVTQDTFHYKNPFLPLTQSEMAVPLLVGNTVIGALDAQSTLPNAFDEEVVDFLLTVAATLSMSIDRTMKVNDLEKQLSEITEKETNTTVKSWQAHLKGSRKKFYYRYSQSDASLITENSNPPSEAVAAGKSSKDTNSSSAKTATISVPIKLRDQVLGMINLKVEGDQSPAEINQLVNSASERLALALENARLLEEIQERADREHLVSNISDRVRSATDIDSILKTTVQELGKTMGVGEVRIQLKTRDAR
ncbi:MAG: GAF domain-containing protein [Anaerolineaceae bacterium]